MGACYGALKVVLDDWNELSALHPWYTVGLAIGAAIGGGAVAAMIGTVIGWLVQHAQQRK
jgi:hypothetical protein